VPPGTSHVTGLTTIARGLCGRGHRATVFNILDVEDLARREMAMLLEEAPDAMRDAGDTAFALA
jgi:hypothetical protein